MAYPERSKFKAMEALRNLACRLCASYWSAGWPVQDKTPRCANLCEMELCCRGRSRAFVVETAADVYPTNAHPHARAPAKRRHDTKLIRGATFSGRPRRRVATQHYRPRSLRLSRRGG